MKNSYIIILLTGLILIPIYSKYVSKSSQVFVPPMEKTQTTEKVAPKTVTSYDEAIASAKESGCNIFLYFGAPWCGYCEQMKKTTLVDSDVKDKLSKNFVILIINIDENKSLAHKFSVDGIPAYMVVDSNGKVIRKAIGYKAKNEFLSWLGDK